MHFHLILFDTNFSKTIKPWFSNVVKLNTEDLFHEILIYVLSVVSSDVCFLKYKNNKNDTKQEKRFFICKL